MKLETSEVQVKFGIESAEYKKRLSKRFDFLIGKYFGLKGKEECSKDRYFGKIESVSAYDEINRFNCNYLMKLEIEYIDKNKKTKITTIVFEDNGYLTKNRVLVYGDDEDSVKLELMLTEK